MLQGKLTVGLYQATNGITLVLLHSDIHDVTQCILLDKSGTSSALIGQIRGDITLIERSLCQSLTRRDSFITTHYSTKNARISMAGEFITPETINSYLIGSGDFQMLLPFEVCTR